MKKFLVIILFLLTGTSLCPSANATNPDFSLTNFTKFRGIYQKIYDDVNHEDPKTICRRVLDYPEFWEDGTRIYSLSNCENLINTENLSDSFLNIKNKSNKEFKFLANNFANYFALEKDLLRLENDTKRQFYLQNIFLNGSDQDSAFDLVSSLNKIDEILNGEKATNPRYNYLKPTDTDLAENLAENEDFWLSQTEQEIDLSNEKYSNPAESLAGNLWQAQKYLREKVNSKPLWTNKHQKTILENPDKEGVFTNPCLDPQLYSIPPISSDLPSQNNADNYSPLAKLNFTDQNLYNISVYRESREKNDHAKSNLEINQKIRDQQIKINQFVDNFTNEVWREEETNYFTNIYPALDNLLENLHVFTEKLEELNKEIFPEFLDKPIHQS